LALGLLVFKINFPGDQAMEGSISLSARDYKTLLHCYRTSRSPAVRLRAHILLLLHERVTWNLIATLLFTSPSTIARWKQRFETQGLAAITEEQRGRPRRLSWKWLAIIVLWVTTKTPRDFGFLRSRWSCATLVLVLVEKHDLQVSVETVRRWLHQKCFVWRRPRPVLGPKDPAYAYQLGKLRRLLQDLPADETAVFQDEVDVNLNPKIGSMWMRRGEQAEVVTPGNNEKRYLAGSLHWRTGKLFVSDPGTNRNAKLFVAHLHDLRQHLRRYRCIHVICDNAKFHDCRLVQAFLKRWGHRIQIHFLPKYSPQTNPIERVWWHLHEELTRNHRCRSMNELVQLVFDWIEAKENFGIETSKYPQALAA
jgi:transposase